jgi:peptide/nickel transport system substrate-binding protein
MAGKKVYPRASVRNLKPGFQMHRRVGVVLLIGILLVPLVLTACGPTAAPTEVVQPTQAPAEEPVATEAAATEAPAEQGTGVLVYGATDPTGSIDPAVCFSTWCRYITDNVYDSLFRFEGSPPKLVNHLAESYEASADGLEWTFTLRENVKFHDGSDLTASDVKYTLDRMLALQDAPSYLWASVDPDKTEVIDERTIKLGLNESFGPFLFTLPWLYIVNEDQVKANEKDGDWGKEWLTNNEAGSGPFQIDTFEADVRIALSYFPDFWKGWPEQRLDGWVYEIHREQSTLKQLLADGKIHMTDWLNEDDYATVAQDPALTVISSPTMTPFMFKLNNQKEPTSNGDFRRALTYAVDYDAIIQGLFSGAATPLDSPLTPDFPGYLSLLTPKRDLDKAKEYLVKSGYDPAQVNLAFEYVAGSSTQENLGLILQQNFKDLGIEMTVEGFTWPVSQERYKTPETAGNVYPIWASADYPDSEAILYPYYHSREPGTGTWFSVSHYNNPEYDELIDSARIMPNLEDRIPIYEELQQILVDDAVDIWVMAQEWRVAMPKCVQGYSFQPAGMLSTYFYPIYLENCE